jgi:hypothetical protein
MWKTKYTDEQCPINTYLIALTRKIKMPSFNKCTT